MENNQPLKTVEEQITYTPEGEKVVTTTTKTITQKEDGSTRISEHYVTKKQGNEINVKDSTIVGEKEVEAGKNDTQYLDAIRTKGELAILKGENQLINIVNLESFERILKLMGIDLNEFYYYISFGIYSSEEITEFRKSLSTKIETQDKVDDYYKDYDYITAPDEKLILPTFFGDEIFESVQKRIDLIMAKREKERKEEELRLQQELEEKKLKEKEELRLKQEEEERLQKEKEEKERLEEEERKRKEEELRLQKVEEERIEKEKEEMEKLEEEERKKKEEELRLQKEEEERIKKEEEEKKKKEFEEKRQREIEEKKQKELEEQKKKEIEIKKKKDEEEKKKKEMEEKKKKEMEENLKKKKEEEEKIKKDLEEQKKKKKKRKNY